jgi:hypothetical protein
MMTVTWSTVAKPILEPTLVLEREFGRGDLFAEHIGDYTGQAREPVRSLMAVATGTSHRRSRWIFISVLG